MRIASRKRFLVSAPLSEVQKMSSSNVVAKRKKGANWTEDETRGFLETCIEKQILKLMHGKRHKHGEIYKVVEKAMRARGFVKTVPQMQIKMKHLKEIYYKCVRNNGQSGVEQVEFPYFDLMDELLNSRPRTVAVEEGSQGLDNCADPEYDESQYIKLEETHITEEETDELPTGNTTRLIEEHSESSVESTGFSTLHRSKENKSSGPIKRGGRKSYAKTMSEFTKSLVCQQSQAFRDIMTEQNRVWAESMAEQWELQRKWEQQVIEQEQEFQHQMMETMMSTLMQGFQCLQQAQTPFSMQNMASGALITPDIMGPSESNPPWDHIPDAANVLNKDK